MTLFAAAAFAVPSQATAPQPQTIEMAGHLTGPNTIAGTWSGAGFVDDAGTLTQTFRFAGKTIHDEKVWSGHRARSSSACRRSSSG